MYMSMKNEPLVSVLMTAYNRESYIGEAIESVLLSTYKYLELIIVDDCSIDRSFEIAAMYAAKDERVRVYRNDQNLGDYINRNRAAGYAKGKYLKYLDSDDKIYPWGLAAMVSCMECYPEAGLGLMSYGLPANRIYPIKLSPQEAYTAFFFRNALWAMGPSGAILRRSAFETMGGFSGKPYVGDTELWLKMARGFDLVRMPLDLIWWREHEQQQLKEGIQNNYYQKHLLKVYEEALMHPHCPLDKKWRGVALRNMRNIRARNAILDFASLKFRKSVWCAKMNGLSVKDILLSLKPNRYPEKKNLSS